MPDVPGIGGSDVDTSLSVVADVPFAAEAPGFVACATPTLLECCLSGPRNARCQDRPATENPKRKAVPLLQELLLILSGMNPARTRKCDP